MLEFNPPKDIRVPDKKLLKREVEVHLEFQTPGEFYSMYAAERWLHENGYSSGSTDITKFVGLLKGEKILIAKWKNLTKDERAALDGVMYAMFSYRTGPVEVIIFKKEVEND